MTSLLKIRDRRLFLVLYLHGTGCKFPEYDHQITIYSSTHAWKSNREGVLKITWVQSNNKGATCALCSQNWTFCSLYLSVQQFMVGKITEINKKKRSWHDILLLAFVFVRQPTLFGERTCATSFVCQEKRISAIFQIHLSIQPTSNEIEIILKWNNKSGVWHGVWCTWGYVLWG